MVQSSCMLITRVDNTWTLLCKVVFSYYQVEACKGMCKNDGEKIAFCTYEVFQLNVVHVTLKPLSRN